MTDALPPSTSFSLTDDNGDNVKAGLTLVAIVLLFLFCLVALRLFCNVVIIDLCVLRDDQSLFRCLSEVRRIICPCWHPRTEPQNITDDEGRNQTSNTSTEMVSMESLLVGLTQAQKQDLLSSILVSKMVTNEDILAWKNQSQSPCADLATSKLAVPDGNGVIAVIVPPPSLDCCKSDMEGRTTCGAHEGQHDQLICPICIHDIQAGDRACYSRFCHHKFHRDCLSAWLSTNSRLCPYCRQEIVSQEMLDEAHRIKQSWRETSWDEEDDDDDDDDDDSSTRSGCNDLSNR